MPTFSFGPGSGATDASYGNLGSNGTPWLGRLRKYGSPVPLGRGATGVVYKMLPPVRHVTKVIGCGHDAGLLRDALYELRVMRRLESCPLTLRLVDSEVVSASGELSVCIVEEYCTSLVEATRDRSLSVADCVDVAIGVTDALIACRDAGVLHLDVQPKNVYLSDGGEVRLGDFGSSLLVEDAGDRSRLRGTLAFMAPEVFRDRMYSERSDIYSVGILLYCLLNGGVYPFTDNVSATEAAYRLLAGERLPKIARLDERQRAPVEAALSRICAFDVSGRPQSFESLRDCLVALRGSIVPTGAVDAVSSAGSPMPYCGGIQSAEVPDPSSIVASGNPPREVLPIIYVIDASGSMAGERIGAVNLAMWQASDMMKDIARRHPEVEIGVAVLTFSSGATWITREESGKPCLVAMKDFAWRDLDARGLTDVGAALKELNGGMSREGLFSEGVGYKMPVIIFMSDGEPTDDWEGVLGRMLPANKWFRYATKICMAVGADANKDVLARVAGGPDGTPNAEAVIDVQDSETLKDLVRVVSVTASRLGSTHDGGGELREAILAEVANVISPGDDSEDATPKGLFVEGDSWLGLDADADEAGWYGGGGAWRRGWESGWDTGGSWSGWGSTGQSSSACEVPQTSAGVLFDADPIAASVAMGSFGDSIAGSPGPLSTAVAGREVSNGGVAQPAPLRIDKVRFSVVSPRAVERDEYATIDMFMYEQEFREVVEQLKEESFTQVQERQSGFLAMHENSTVRVVLSSEAIRVKDGEQEQTWLGGFLSFSFDVLVPYDYARNTIPFAALVYVDGIMATRLKFVVRCTGEGRQKPEVVRRDVHSAFVSYASADRDRVVALIQGMRAARPDLEIFFDVQSLRVGEDWEHTIMREVESRDVLYLCWSRSARASKYVDLEWRHALETKGIDYIEPVPIEPPTVCPPPEELRAKHFNDVLLYLLNRPSLPAQPGDDDWGDAWDD